jgi:hypothetical protein
VSYPIFWLVVGTIAFAYVWRLLELWIVETVRDAKRFNDPMFCMFTAVFVVFLAGVVAAYGGLCQLVFNTITKKG